MRTWLRDHGLLLANLALFVVFIGGMVLTGVRVYNDEQIEHGGEAGLARRLPEHRRLRRGDLRELGERVPADGHVRRAHRVPVPARLVGVQADRRAGAAGRGPARARGRPGCARGRCSVAAGCSRSYENSLAASVLPVLPRLLAAARRRRRPGVQRGAAGARRRGGDHRGSTSTTSQFWFESFQNWQSEFLAVAAIVGASVYLRQRGLGRVQAGRRAARRDRGLSRVDGCRRRRGEG